MPTPIELAKPDFTNVVSHLDKELHNIRSGRANASIVEEILVEAYGSMMPLKGVANLSTPDAKTIQIEPWDKNLVKDVERAIISANIGLTPNTASSTIRLVMPPMTEENRKEMVKSVGQKGEHARIGVRNVRETVRDTILAMDKEKTIGEDEKHRLLEDLDKAVAGYNKQIEDLVRDKEEEVMTI